jgi:hypothetical protein
VNIITSTAERQAAVEFAKAGATRPQIVGAALNQISKDPDVAEAMFNLLETQKMLEGGAAITLIPSNPSLLADLLAAAPGGPAPKPADRSAGSPPLPRQGLRP